MTSIIPRAFKTAEDFAKYVDEFQMGAWKPSFVTMHHTAAPDLKTYAGWKKRAHPVSDVQWGNNLWSYYQGKGWRGCPHVYVLPGTENFCLLMNPFDRPGVHAVSFNRNSWGVEVVGDFDSEPFDGQIKQNAVAALAILFHKLGSLPYPFVRGERGLHFHRDDPKTNKTCPGNHVSKSGMQTAIVDEMNRRWPPKPVKLQGILSLFASPTPDSLQKPPTPPLGGWLDWLIEDEGVGLEVRPNEPGGAVNMGISMTDLREHRNDPSLGFDELANITREEVRAIANKLYYKRYHCDTLPKGLDYCHFDACFNDGAGAEMPLAALAAHNPVYYPGARHYLQKAVGTTIDGVIGTATLQAAHAGDPKQMIESYCAARLQFKRMRPGWKRYGAGWTNRVNRVETRALSLINGG